MGATAERVRSSATGDIYVIRDVWRDASIPRGLVRCEYAVMEGDTRVWKPCAEGVLFSDIEPFVVVDG